MTMQLYLDVGAAFGIKSFAKMRTIFIVMNLFLLVQCWPNWTLEIWFLHAEKQGFYMMGATKGVACTIFLLYFSLIVLSPNRPSEPSDLENSIYHSNTCYTVSG